MNDVQREQITPEKICNEETVQWTVTTPLYDIGEHVYNLSDDFKKSHPEIPWIKIAGLRHRLVPTMRTPVVSRIFSILC